MNDHHNEFIENKRTQPLSSSAAITIDSEDPFSSLSLLDPSHEISQSSKEAGRIAGRTASFNEGRSIGRTKGWEVGLELGYVFSFCMELLEGLKLLQQNDDQSSSNIDNDDDGNKSGNMQTSTLNKKSSSNRAFSRLDRCTTLARDIITLIEDFPPPQHLLDNLDDDGNDNDADDAAADSAAAALDVSTPIQRIRAKFKLLSVLLKTGQSYDLKRILELKGESSGEVGNDGTKGVSDVDANDVKLAELQKDDGVVARGRRNKDVQQKSNGGDDW